MPDKTDYPDSFYTSHPYIMVYQQNELTPNADVLTNALLSFADSAQRETHAPKPNDDGYFTIYYCHCWCRFSPVVGSSRTRAGYGRQKYSGGPRRSGPAGGTTRWGPHLAADGIKKTEETARPRVTLDGGAATVTTQNSSPARYLCPPQLLSLAQKVTPFTRLAPYKDFYWRNAPGNIFCFLFRELKGPFLRVVFVAIKC